MKLLIPNADDFGFDPAINAAIAQAHTQGLLTSASLLVARDPSGRTDLTLAVTLAEPPGDGQVELLDFVAAIAAAVAAT